MSLAASLEVPVRQIQENLRASLSPWLMGYLFIADFSLSGVLILI
jgi:hypothetical protein